MRTRFVIPVSSWVSVACSHLAVTVLPSKPTAQKVVAPLAMKNGFAKKVASARAACFLLDVKGRVAGRSKQSVIGAGRDKSPLGPGAASVFNFVVATARPMTTTNLTAKVSFSRVVLEGWQVGRREKGSANSEH